MRFVRSLMLLGLLVGSSYAVSLDGEEATLSRYSKSYIGKENVTVTVAPYKVERKEGALIQFSGVEGPWDGQVLNFKKLPRGRDSYAYVTRYEDRDFYALYVDRSQGGDRVRLFVPESDFPKDGLLLSPSDRGAKIVAPETIWNEYSKKMKVGE